MATIQIVNGIPAADAAREAGLNLNDVIALVKCGAVFGMASGGRWYVSPSALPVLERIAARRRERERRKIAAL